MFRNPFIVSISVILTFLTIACLSGGSAMSQSESGATVIQLPEPSLSGDVSLEECLASRRSVRKFEDRSLTLEEISQILWSAQGITADWGARTAPSAGALFPIRLYLAVRDVETLTQGSWEYDPENHSLKLVKEGDLHFDLTAAALGQSFVGEAQAVLIIAAIPEITMARYGNRSMRYIDQEVGCICQNVYLQCGSLGLGTVAVGAMDDNHIAEIVSTKAEPRLIMPIGPVQ